MLLAVFVLGALSCAASPDALPSLSREATAGAPAEVGEPPANSWCIAREVLERKCQRCHGEEPEHGAPFALVSYEDTQVVNAKGRPRYELIASAVESERMPPSFLKPNPPVEPLTDSERATLLDWCDGGAPGPSVQDPPCGS